MAKKKDNDKKITVNKKKGKNDKINIKKENPLEKLNLPENPDEETVKKIAKAFKQWISDD
ncbi:MAG: hypothetical protein ACQESP_00230 [Candidatus Muiribacteriota bacterium]